MFRIAVMLLHDEDDSKDIVHEIFAKLLDGEISFNEEKARAFLLSCVRNSCLNRIRDRNLKEQAMRHYLLDSDQSITRWPQRAYTSHLPRNHTASLPRWFDIQSDC